MAKHLVIMAGGIGSRFWPMSTPQCPKDRIHELENPKREFRLHGSGTESKTGGYPRAEGLHCSGA